MRLPTPARRCWSMSRALRATALCSRARRSSAGGDREGVGPEHRLVGVELHPTEQAGVADHHPTAVGEDDGEPVPRRSRRARSSR